MVMGAVKRDLDQKVCEAAEQRAVKLTGRAFSELPQNEQYRIFQEAEQDIRDRYAEGVELLREVHEERMQGGGHDKSYAGSARAKAMEQT
jgi:hypothetical protein